MFDTLKSRLVVIGLLVATSVWAIWPREVTTRVRQADGTMRDSVSREWNIKQGLDLQGGIHLALELDESRGQVPNRSDAIDRALTVIRTRIDEFGVAEPVVQRSGSDRIVVELAGIDDPQRAKDIVQRSAFLEFQLTDESQSFARALPAIDRALAQAGVTEASIRSGQAADTSKAGAAPAPASSIENLLGGPDTSKAAGQDTAAAADSALLGTSQGALSTLLQGGSMAGEFRVPLEKQAAVSAMINHAAALRHIPRGIVLRWSADTVAVGARPFVQLYALQERAMITGEYLVDAQARLDPLYNQAVVDFQLSRRGGRIFERETGRNVQKYMAIVLDGRVQSQPPVIRSQIGQRGQIELGSASLQEAQDLALVLKAGALPAPLQVVEEQQVGASLGEDSIRRSILAGVVGVALMILMIVGYYRFAGLLAVMALGIYCLFTAGGLAMLGSTLTLPGVAGFLLSIGMAVDANVLIFERIREELEHGKSVRLAIDAGFKMAWSAIIDGHVTTIVTAAFLFMFGTGPVKGFAVTLIIGIIASLISAVYVTRTFFMIYLNRRSQPQTLSI